MKKLSLILIWLLSLIAISIYVNENPERIEIIKGYFSKDKIPILRAREGEIKRSPGNSFMVEFLKVILLKIFIKK